MPLPSVRTVGRAVDVWVAVLRSWRFSEGDQPRCTPGRPSAWRPASSSPCTAFATCPAAMLRVIAAVARSTRGLRGGGRGATDLIAASAYWISARDHFALIFPLLPVADVKAGFKVSGCLSLIEGSDRSLWPRCCRSICRHRRPLRSGYCRSHAMLQRQLWGQKQTLALALHLRHFRFLRCWCAHSFYGAVPLHIGLGLKLLI